MSEAINISVNGEPAEAAVGSSVDELLEARGIIGERRNGIAVAVNLSVVPRSAWSTTSINHGDKVEIVTAVQGG